MNKYILFSENINIDNDNTLIKTPRATHIYCIKVDRCIVNYSGFITTSKNVDLSFNKWYNKKTPHKLCLDLKDNSILSLAQIWNNSFQHIAFDTLSKVGFIQKVLEYDENVKLLVMNKTQKNMLNKYLNLNDSKYVYVNNHNYIVKTGYYINSYSNKGCKMGDFGKNQIYNYLLDNNRIISGGMSHLIYISRYGNNKRSISHKLEQLLIKFFRKYCSENNLIFYTTNRPDSEEAISLFPKCKYFISPHGGAMANMIFLNNDCSVIEIIKEKNLIERPCFYFLALSLNIKYNFFEPEYFDFDKNYISFSIDKFIKYFLELTTNNKQDT